MAHLSTPGAHWNKETTMHYSLGRGRQFHSWACHKAINLELIHRNGVITKDIGGFFCSEGRQLGSLTLPLKASFACLVWSKVLHLKRSSHYFHQTILLLYLCLMSDCRWSYARDLKLCLSIMHGKLNTVQASLLLSGLSWITESLNSHIKCRTCVSLLCR